MGFFDLFRRGKKTLPWRDSSGKVYCPGDRCPSACDDNCPVWCLTVADKYRSAGQNARALKSLEKAVGLAPDFISAWLGIGSICGSGGNHHEAYKAFAMARKLDVNNKKALYGLIVSAMNTGNLDEAETLCKEYSLKFDMVDAEALKCEINRLRQSSSGKQITDSIDLWFRFVEHAQQTGFIRTTPKAPYIPEIMSGANPTCEKIFDALVSEHDCRNPLVWLSWAAFAGMGLVWHWHVDWPGLLKKGYFETLTAPRGIYAMDEYVTDAIGIGYNSENGKAFTAEVTRLAVWAIDGFIDKSRFSRKNVIETMTGMYNLGMVYEMLRLGMM